MKHGLHVLGCLAAQVDGQISEVTAPFTGFVARRAVNFVKRGFSRAFGSRG